MLQYLLLDPSYGYLYPHRQAISAFGVSNEYQLTKHRPHLVKGQHWHKLPGADHIERVFYSLPGLERLTQLIDTPQAKAFWQSLTQHIQPGGAIVPVLPASLYIEPEPPTSLTEAIEIVPVQVTPTLSQYPAPALQPVLVDQSAIASPPPPATTTLTPHETAELIFKAQEILGNQIAKTQAAPQVTTTIWQQWDRWLGSQDSIALAIAYSVLLVLLGCGSYFVVSALARLNPPAYPSTSQLTPLPPQK